MPLEREVDALVSPRAMLKAALVVWALFSCVFASVSYWAVRTHGHSPVRIWTYELLVWSGWAIATPVIAWLGRKQPLLPVKIHTALVHVGAACAVSALHMLWWAALYLTIRPYDDMGAHELGELYDFLLHEYWYFEAMAYFAVLGVTYSVDYRRRLQAREIRAAQLEASLATARLDALKLQLQPHFLFNTLHSIGGLVRQSRSREAVEVIAGLSDLLRYSLDHAHEQLVTLDRELAILDRYLAIQKIRFPDRLAVTIDVPDELRRAQVPAMILQPLAENAVRHGIEPSTGPGTIDVRARRAGNRIAIEIVNTGPKLREGESGIGLANTRARLTQLYGANHALVLRNHGDGVIAILEVPG